MSRLRSPAPRSLVALIAAWGGLLGSLAFGPIAAANGGLLYGPEDAVVFGGGPRLSAEDPTGKLQAVGVRGFCVPYSMLAALHIGMGTSITQSSGYARRTLLDLTESIRCGRSFGGNPMMPGLVLMPRVGYTFETGFGGTHLGRFGLGIGFGTSRAAIMYAPHFVFGHDQDQHVRGIRHGMLLSLASDLVAVELSHQVLFGDVGTVQDVRVVGSVNFLILAYVLAH